MNDSNRCGRVCKFGGRNLGHQHHAEVSAAMKASGIATVIVQSRGSGAVPPPAREFAAHREAAQ